MSGLLLGPTGPGPPDVAKGANASSDGRADGGRRVSGALQPIEGTSKIAGGLHQVSHVVAERGLASVNGVGDQANATGGDASIFGR